MEPTTEINEEGRWQVGGSSFCFLPDHGRGRGVTSHTGLRSQHWSVCRSHNAGRRVHSVYCSKSPFPLSDNNTYGTIATLTTSHIRRFAVGGLHILITNDGNSSAIQQMWSTEAKHPRRFFFRYIYLSIDRYRYLDRYLDIYLDI